FTDFSLPSVGNAGRAPVPVNAASEKIIFNPVGRNPSLKTASAGDRWGTAQATRLRTGIVRHPMTKKLQLVKHDLPGPEVASAPPGLGPDGRAMWNAVMREFHITDVGGLLLLEQAAAAADMVARLRAQIDKDGLTVELASGTRSNPMLKDELGFRCFITN